MNKNELNELLDKEKSLYLGDREKEMKHRRHKRYTIWKYLYYFRLTQYNSELRADSPSGFERQIAKYKQHFYNRKFNIYGERAGVEIGLNSQVGQCPDIWHGGVVINGTVGDNCIFHGNNCIGKKPPEAGTPVLGDNVDMGVGSVAIGNITIASGCKIGANAVVTKSFNEPDSVIVGVPGRKVSSHML